LNALDQLPYQDDRSGGSEDNQKRGGQHPGCVGRVVDGGGVACAVGGFTAGGLDGGVGCGGVGGLAVEGGGVAFVGFDFVGLGCELGGVYDRARGGGDAVGAELHFQMLYGECEPVDHRAVGARAAHLQGVRLGGDAVGLGAPGMLVGLAAAEGYHQSQHEDCGDCGDDRYAVLPPLLFLYVESVFCHDVDVSDVAVFGDGIEAGALLDALPGVYDAVAVGVLGGDVAVSEDAGTGIACAQLAQQAHEGFLLRGGAVVDAPSLGVYAPDIGDVDAVVVVSLDTVAHEVFALGAYCAPVTLDDVVVARGFPAEGVAVVADDVVRALCLRPCGAVDDDVVDCSHCLNVEF